MANWASLPHDLLVLIVGLVKKFQDFAAFGAVCKSWHAAASKEYFKALWLQEKTPYLMLPVRRDGGNILRDLYSLAEGEIVASVRVRNLSKRKCFESLGWFLAVEKDGSTCLLDPFSSIEISLPHLKTLKTMPDFKDFHPYEIVKKMVLSARPSDPSDPSDFVVALIFRCIVGVAFWRPGNKSWRLARQFDGGMYEDITYHAGNFYSLDEGSEVKIFNILEGYPIKGKVFACFVPDDLPNDMDMDMIRELLSGKNVYIVKVPGSLLLVTRTLSRSGYICSKTRKFQVYEFHMPSNTWREINNLGNMALFLGSENATTIVDALRFPGFIKANHIYFTDDGRRNPFGSDGCPDKVTGRDMGIYNLETGTIDLFYHGEAFNSKVSHPTWILPFLWSLTADEMHTL